MYAFSHACLMDIPFSQSGDEIARKTMRVGIYSALEVSSLLNPLDEFKMLCEPFLSIQAWFFQHPLYL